MLDRIIVQDNDTAFWGYLVVAIGFLIVACSYKKDWNNACCD